MVEFARSWRWSAGTVGLDKGIPKKRASDRGFRWDEGVENGGGSMAFWVVWVGVVGVVGMVGVF